MTRESYTPGHERNAESFMARCSLLSHGSFFMPYLHRCLSVLDCGCGPGTITSGIAAHVKPGQVIGVDLAPSQIDRATAQAAEAGLNNATFHGADCYALPFDDGHFDRVFSHALIEHLSDPIRALTELHRVLKPEGFIGVCSPDWGGFLLSPPSPELYRAVEAYRTLQASNGGDVEVGRKLGLHLTAAGFKVIQCPHDTNVITRQNSLRNTWLTSSSARAIFHRQAPFESGVRATAVCLLSPGYAPSASRAHDAALRARRDSANTKEYRTDDHIRSNRGRRCLATIRMPLAAGR